MNQRAQSLGRSAMTAALVAASMVLLAAPAMATPNAADLTSEPWGEWRALSDGFVGRRREPPGLEQAAEQRRLPQVQEQARLLEHPGAKGRARAAQASGLAPAGLSADAAPQALGLPTQQVATSAWIKTNQPGLYSVPLEEIAASSGMDGRLLRTRAQQGRLRLLNEGSNVAWRYDRASRSLQFAAELHETFYAEGNAYEVVLARGKDPQQMSEIKRPGRGAAAPATPSPFTATASFEEEPDMYFQTSVVAQEPDADFWFWDYLWGGYQDEIELELDLPDPAATGTAELRVDLRGWTRLNPGNEHQVYAELNGQPVGSVVWDGFDAAMLVAQFDQSLLSPDGNNTLRLSNKYPAGTHPGQFLDAIEVDYQRLPVARDGQLWLRGAAGGTQTVSGFATDDVFVIESPVRNARLRSDARVYMDGAGWSVDFSAAAGADYLVVEAAAFHTAGIEGPATESLRDPGNAAAYLIIAPREFAGTADALATYRTVDFGAVKIAWLDDIEKEFGAGRVDPFAIGRFMQHVMSDWQQAPSVVLIVGKGSLDHKDRMGYGDSFVPVVMTSNPWTLAASDSRLLGFEDGITPFAYGRLAIANDEEGLAYVEKLAAHELRLRGARVATVAADNPDDAGDFHAHAAETADLLVGLGLDGAWQYLHPDDPVRSALVSSDIWDDSIYVSYDGHGAVQQIGNGSERFLTAADAKTLTNEHLPVFTALTCASGDDSLPATRSVASTLVLNPGGGAIASLAPTGLSLGPDAHALGMAFVESIFGQDQRVGAALASAKRSVDGQISAFMSPMYAVLGDPAARAQ